MDEIEVIKNKLCVIEKAVDDLKRRLYKVKTGTTIINQTTEVTSNVNMGGHSFTNLGTSTSNVNMGGYIFTNSGTPVSSGDLATKAYVDDRNFGTQNDVTASRALDTVYRNANAFSIVVMVSIQTTVTNTAASIFGTSHVYPRVGSNNPPTTEIGDTGIYLDISGLEALETQELNNHSVLTLIIPPSYYYKLVTFISGDGATPQANYWFEYGGTGSVP